MSRMMRQGKVEAPSGRGAVQPQQPVAMIDTTSDDDVGEAAADGA